MSNKSYAEKLRDPRWQKMRLRIMERDEFKCRHCSSSAKTLNVHHSFYTKGASPWDYDETTLLTLCEDCHAAVEHRNQLILAATANSPYRQQRVLVYLDAINGEMPFDQSCFMWFADAFHGVMASWQSLFEARLEDGDEISQLERLKEHALAAFENLGAILKTATATNAQALEHKANP